jgi:hypothetical protein
MRLDSRPMCKILDVFVFRTPSCAQCRQDDGPTDSTTYVPLPVAGIERATCRRRAQDIY